MSTEVISILAGAICGAGGLVSGLFAWLQARASIKVQMAKDAAAAELAKVIQAQSDERAEEDQPVMHFQKLVEMQERRILKLEQDHTECEKSHRECLETTGDLKGEIGQLKGRVEVLMKFAENFSSDLHGALPGNTQPLELRGSPPLKPSEVVVVIEDNPGVHQK